MFSWLFCLGWLGLSLSLSDSAADTVTCQGREENYCSSSISALSPRAGISYKPRPQKTICIYLKGVEVDDGIKEVLFMLRAVVPNGTLHADMTYKACCFVPAVL